MEGLERELKSAMAEKQTVIRGLEDELQGVRGMWEREVGVLNVSVARMAGEVEGERRRAVEGGRRVREALEGCLGLVGEWDCSGDGGGGGGGEIVDGREGEGVMASKGSTDTGLWDQVL